MMMMMVIVRMMVKVCNDDCYLVMKVIFVKEVMSCDVSPVAMLYFQNEILLLPFCPGLFAFSCSTLWPVSMVITPH